MAEDEEEEGVPHVRSEGFRVVYSNFIQPGRTAWDIAILFGQIGESEPGKPAVIDQVTAVITPALAKAFVGVLNAHVKSYERENGEIMIPESVRAAAQERRKLASPSASVSPSASTSPSASASPSPENEDEE
jgi:hypothetical protein